MNSKFPVKVLKPNEKNDWINQRNTDFENYIIVGNKKNKLFQQKFFCDFYSRGIATSRDNWCYNFSKNQLDNNIQETIKFYNSEVINFQNNIHYELDMNSKKISWSDGLKQSLKRKIFLEYNYNQIVKSIYRPYCREYLYYDKYLNERTYQMPKIFPTAKHKNLLICVSGIGGSKEHSVFISNCIIDLNCLDAGTQCFPLYYYEQREKVEQSLFDNEQNEYIRHDGITDFIFNQAKELYGNKVSKEDIFFYVYGFLHLPKYRQEFSADLKKSLPRIFLVDEPKVFWQISKAGRDLADIHLNYENQKAPEGVIIEGDCDNYTVSKMKFPKKDQKDTIIYNNDITIKNIPLEVYNYVINGRSPVEWIMERYQVKIDKASGIENNPNDWATEHNQPRYILDLLLSVMTVSLKTQEIVNSLPDVKFE